MPSSDDTLARAAKSVVATFKAEAAAAPAAAATAQPAAAPAAAAPVAADPNRAGELIFSCFLDYYIFIMSCNMIHASILQHPPPLQQPQWLPSKRVNSDFSPASLLYLLCFL